MPEPGYKKRKAKWERQEMLDAGHQWIEESGEIPAATDFHPGDARYCARISFARGRRWLERARRAAEGLYPWPATVIKEFGSWANYIRALGHEPRKQSIPDISRALPRHDLGRIKEIANIAVKSDGDERRVALYDLIDAASAQLDTLD